MKRLIRLAAVLVAVLSMLMVTGYFTWRMQGEAGQRALLENLASWRIGVPIKIQGDFTLQIGREVEFTSNGILVGTPAKAMVEASGFTIHIRTISLFAATTWITYLHAREVDINLVADESVENESSEGNSSEPFNLNWFVINGSVNHLTLSYDATWFEEPGSAVLDEVSIQSSPDGEVRLNGAGLINGDPITFMVNADSVERIVNNGLVNFEARIELSPAGRPEEITLIEVDGHAIGLLSNIEYDLDLHLEGSDLQQAPGQFGISDFPAGPYSIDVRLRGDEQLFAADQLHLRVGDWTAHLNGSSKEGKLRLDGALQGPDADAFMNHFTELGLPRIPFVIEGAISLDPDGILIGFHDTLATLENGITIRFDGTLAGLTQYDHDWSALDLRLDVAGPDLDELLQTSYRSEPLDFDIGARLHTDERALNLSDLSGRVTTAAVRGELSFVRQARMLVAGRLYSEFLDLSGLLGDEGPAPAKPGERRIPKAEVPKGLLTTADLDLQLESDRLKFADLVVEDIAIQIELNEGVARLDLHQARMLDGSLVGKIQMSESARGSKIHANLEGQDLVIDNIHGLKELSDDRPRTRVQLELQSSGASVQQFAANLDGSFRLEESAGLIDTQPIMDLLRVINPETANQPQSWLDCTLVVAQAKSGLVQATVFAVQTERLRVVSRGSIDLSTEEIDFRFRLAPRKGVSITGLFSPLAEIRGTLSEPEIKLSPGDALAAYVTDGWSLLIEALAFDAGENENICQWMERQQNRNRR